MNIYSFLLKKPIALLLVVFPIIAYGQWMDPGNDSTGAIYYNNGNVGIGVENPLARLDIKIQGDSAQVLKLNTERPWVFEQQGTGSAASLVLKSIIASKYFRIKDVNDTEVFNINSTNGLTYFSNSLGVGITPSTARLNLKSDVNSPDLLEFSSDRPWLFRQDGTDSGTSLVLQSQTGGKYFRIYDYDNTEAFHVQSTNGEGYFKGNLGVGTSSPQFPLHVNVDNNTNGIILANTGGAKAFLKVSSTGGGQYFGRDSLNNTNVFLNANGSSFLMGYVGIGTSIPTEMLHVNGTIYAKKMKASVEAGADFVFDTGYEIPPLQEVENFVNENKHLPGVQSAASMQKDGVDVIALEIKLLQKIEELTLYLIDQEKRIEEQNKKNVLLVKEIQRLKCAMSQKSK